MCGCYTQKVRALMTAYDLAKLVDNGKGASLDRAKKLLGACQRAKIDVYQVIPLLKDPDGWQKLIEQVR